ncbi:hypothetical protein C8R47DRAFT_170093 [Mycena vitilis]|nr:hypothetical protein C8R47DRAFT_170093 [Mycena vitilis]
MRASSAFHRLLLLHPPPPRPQRKRDCDTGDANAGGVRERAVRPMRARRVRGRRLPGAALVRVADAGGTQHMAHGPPSKAVRMREWEGGRTEERARKKNDVRARACENGMDVFRRRAAVLRSKEAWTSWHDRVERAETRPGAGGGKSRGSAAEQVCIFLRDGDVLTRTDSKACGPWLPRTWATQNDRRIWTEYVSSCLMVTTLSCCCTDSNVTSALAASCTSSSETAGPSTSAHHGEVVREHLREPGGDECCPCPQSRYQTRRASCVSRSCRAAQVLDEEAQEVTAAGKTVRSLLQIYRICTGESQCGVKGCWKTKRGGLMSEERRTIVRGVIHELNDFVFFGRARTVEKPLDFVGLEDGRHRSYEKNCAKTPSRVPQSEGVVQKLFSGSALQLPYWCRAQHKP